MSVVLVETKVCATCEVEKPLAEFARRSASVDGLQHTCRTCKAAAFKRWYEEYGEARNADKREQYRANPEPQRKRRSDWGRRSRTHLNTYQRGYRKTWREAHLARERLRGRETMARRRARLAGVRSERVDAQIVWERDEGVCGICGVAAKYDSFHVDHVIPLVHGGEHTYENVQVDHPICNSSKGARHLDQT